MSSYIATTRHETEPTYAIDTFFTASNYTQQATDLKHRAVVTSSPTNQSNSITYNCLPQGTNTSTVTTLPIENLSIQPHAMAHEWMSPLGYSEYNQPDMNFLFTYDELVIGNKDVSTKETSIPSETSSPIKDNHRNCPSQTTAAEQYRRFSMMDISRSDTYMPSQQKVVGSSPFIEFQSNQFQQGMMNNTTERTSMPNVFAPQHPTVTNDDYLQQQQQWNQSSILSRRPTKEEEEQTKYNNYIVQSNYITPPSNQTVISSSTSSPLKKHAKKRSIIEQVLHEDIPYTMPSVVPSLSEPIPTTTHWVHHRKRTKSIRDQEQPVETLHEEQILESNEKYIMSNDNVPCDNEFNNNNNQLLAAMPRRQKLRYEGDNYTPKWVRYTGHLKEGYCDSCNPGKWLQLKNSAYWYHKQFYHGISSVSGKSFMKPLEQRMGKGDMIEGLCHQCHRFVPACNGKKKNNYMLWYRHAHKCHLYDKPKATLKTMRKLSITTSIPK